MNISRLLPALLATALALPAFAQDAPRPLNLKLPPGELPAASSTVATPANDAPEAGSTAAAAFAAGTTTHRDPPGTYYGDTSGSIGDNQTSSAVVVDDDCDDSTYNQPQVHGSVGVGVIGGNHVSGNYQGGTVNLSQAFGSCDHPSGGISISVGGGTGHFNGRRRH